MSIRKRRSRARRARTLRKALNIAAIAILALGVLGITLTIAFDRQPQGFIQAYPMEYTDLIRRYAGDNGLDPAYVASVILAESSYDPQAVSTVNAQGLMQILPDTGEWIAGKFDETYVEGCLFDPDTNLRYGCWYLGFLMDRYGGDMTCASSAYHQGQGTVDKWLKDPSISEDGLTLTSIPSDATKTYVQRILKYYEKYEKRYAEEA